MADVPSFGTARPVGTVDPMDLGRGSAVGYGNPGPHPARRRNWACHFVSKPKKDTAAVDPVVVAATWILANVDGRDRRLHSSRKGACEQGWNLPDKGSAFPEATAMVLYLGLWPRRIDSERLRRSGLPTSAGTAADGV